MKPTTSLLALGVEYSPGVRHLKDMVHKLSDWIHILKISSVYEHQLTQQHSDSWLWVALLGETQNSLEELQGELQNFQKSLLQVPAFRKTQIKLLVFGERQQMTPDITLPHPDLFHSQAVLQCSAEIWGDFFHPIVKKSLVDLLKERKQTHNLIFYCQGTNLYLRDTNEKT